MSIQCLPAFRTKCRQVGKGKEQLRLLTNIAGIIRLPIDFRCTISSRAVVESGSVLFVNGPDGEIFDGGFYAGWSEDIVVIIDK